MSSPSGLRLVRITASKSSPQLVNAPVTFTAVTEGRTGTLEFRWLLYDGTAWSVLREWGSHTYTWTPSRANTRYRVGVWARVAGQPATRVALSVPFVITTPLKVTSISASVPVIRAGLPVTFTAAASGGTRPYEFSWLLFDGSTWTTLRSWGAGSIAWTPPRPGEVLRVGVWVRSASRSGLAALSVPINVVP